MKLLDIESKYDINRVSFITVVRELFISNFLNRKGMGLLFILFTLFRLINNYLGLILDYTNYTWSYNAVLILLSVIFTSYLLQTALDTSGKVLSRDRFNRSIILLLYILKTVLMFIIYVLPIIVMAAVAVVILNMGLSLIFDFKNPDNVSLIFSIVTGLITSALILQYCFASYLVVTHHENGFTAVRFSRLIFRGNLKSSIALFLSIMILPAGIVVAVDNFIDSIWINIGVDILTTAIVFTGHFILASFLTKAAIKKESTLG